MPKTSDYKKSGRALTVLTGAMVFVLGSFGPGFAQAYDNLPGVKPQEPLNQPPSVVCEQVIVKRQWAAMTNRGPLYDTINRCSRDGGPAFSSPRLPPSNIRQLRGFNY